MTEGKLQPIGDVLAGPSFVWEAKARAEQARARASVQQAPQRLERTHNAEAEAMVLALMAKFGGRPPEAPSKRPRPAPAPRVVADEPSEHDQGDDGLPADPTWLHIELMQVPAVARAGFRGRGENYSRWAWRVALASVMRHAPDQIGSVAGLLVSEARRAAETRCDVRTDDAFCVQPGWGQKAYRFAGVEGYIHLRDGCRCQ